MSDRGNALSRRSFLFQSGGGLGGIALAGLLQGEGLLRGAERTHHRPRAKRVVQLFMAGAASHVDLFDYKPTLYRDHGQPWDPGESVELFQNGHGATLAPPWPFHPYGESGKYLGEVVAPLGACVDDMAFIHSMVGRTGVHSQATYLQATGFDVPGFPGMGAWVSYALGSLNENLPTFVVLPDRRGFASNGTQNWASGFLPAQHQGTMIRLGRAEPLADLSLPADSYVTAAGDSAARDLLRRLNRRHAEQRPGDSRLEARIRAYELAGAMQASAPEALDLSREPQYIRDLYGIQPDGTSFPDQINAVEEADYFGRKCLLARRLLERGVRFVQVWSGCDNAFPRRNWDSHEDIARDHRPLAMGMARGASALIRDLKQRGLLEDTIILWTTEFGRMPCAQSSTGRDHNPFCFTNWLCGGGIRGGVSYGPSDEWGFKPADRDHPTTCHDVHATLLHLLGYDHERLTVRHDGIDRRLTDVHGHVIRPILT